MVIMTAKVSKSKLIAISLLVFVAVILLVLGLSSSARKQAALPENGFQPLPGLPPLPQEELPGCRFAPRCASCHERCLQAVPPVYDSGTAKVRCFLYAFPKNIGTAAAASTTTFCKTAALRSSPAKRWD